MEQVIFGGYDQNLDTTLTKYNSLVGGYIWTATEHHRRKIVTTNGKIKNFRVRLDGAPGVGTKYTFTLMLNGAPTALTFDIAGAATTGSNIVNEVTVTGGDTVSIRCVPDSTPTARYATWTSVFEGDTAKESLILGGSSWSLDNAATEYGQVMCAFTFWPLTENDHREVVPTSGTIKNLYVKLSTDPGTAPDAYRFTLRKNGVSQALTVTITADDTAGSDLVNTVDVVAGDVLTLMVEPLNTPSATPIVRWGMTFVADIDGESIILGGSSQDLDAAATKYHRFTSYEALFWEANEVETYHLGQVCTLKKLQVLLSGSPGAGNKYDFTIRIAGADSNVVATISDAATTGNSGALEDAVVLDEYVNLKVVPTDTPTVRDAYWGLVCYIAPPSGSAELLAWLEVGQGTAELLSQVVIRHVGTPIELSGKFEAQATAELLCKAKVRHVGTPVELWGRFEAQTTAELLANAEIINIGSAELLAETAIKQIGTPVELSVKIVIRQVGTPVELPGKITIRHTVPVELLSRGIIRHVGIPVELLGRVEVGQGSVDLPARFEVGQGAEELLGRTAIRHPATSDLKLSLYVRPRHLTAAEMLIGGRDRRIDLGGLDRKMVVGGRDRRMRIR